jgi:hypothetical protein
MSDGAGDPESLIVLCDANVRYSIVMTDLILSLGSAELFHLRWTDQIHDEWMSNLLADRPELDPAKIERRRNQMDAAIDDCLIDGFERLIPNQYPACRSLTDGLIHAFSMLLGMASLSFLVFTGRLSTFLVLVLLSLTASLAMTFSKLALYIARTTPRKRRKR